MDFISHALWSGALSRVANLYALKKKKRKPFIAWQAMFWGIFPDALAFFIPIFWLSFTGVPEPGVLEPLHYDGPFLIQKIAWWLYHLSHSAVIFAVFAGLLFLHKRKIVWEMFFWLGHIITDVVTHSYAFDPTPILWPLSEWRFDGLPWRTPWFLALNYLAIAAVYIWLRKEDHKLE